MNDLTQRAQRWYWRWLPILQEAIRIAETELEKFKVLNGEHVKVLCELDKADNANRLIAEDYESLQKQFKDQTTILGQSAIAISELRSKVTSLEEERRLDAKALEILKQEHHLTRLENTTLHQQRVEEAERHQQLRDDYQLLKHELSELQKENLKRIEAEKIIGIKADSLEEERTNLIERCHRAEEGVKAFFTYIQRNKIKSDNGREIPDLTRFPNIFQR